ncbi:carbohydrate kinase family protein [Desulfospira joergensenii]|uniref:carbohydrate kinase family protein n=1 Tax=Desulfospira joergensenii TaxID=53329 RepID=UPI0003B369C8|nr:PfkB family carbohydrate kinase [Desulfospira joergensenii]
MILVLGEILFDLFPDDKRMGGAPFNFAFHLKKLGFPVRFVSRVGKDSLGREILAFLEKHDFPHEDIQTDPDHDTGRVEISMGKNKTHEFTILPDAAWDHLAFEDRLARLLDQSPELLYFGSLIQREEKGQKLIQQALERKPVSTRVFCDINLRSSAYSRETILACLRASDILKLNDQELKEVSGIDPFSPDIRTRMEEFMAAHEIGLIILTLGSRGSQWFTKNHSPRIGSESSRDILDTVGAGDAYAAMSAAGLLKGLPMDRTAGLAHEFASRICTIRGALPQDPALYLEFIKRLEKT